MPDGPQALVVELSRRKSSPRLQPLSLLASSALDAVMGNWSRALVGLLIRSA